MRKILLLVFLLPFSINANDLLKSLGVLAGQNVYLTYAAIGSTADGYINGSYSAEEAAGLMDTYQNFSQQSADLLDELGKSKLIKVEDRPTIHELKKTYFVLQKQAAEFKKYITLGDQVHIEGYEVNRMIAWKSISKILSLPEN